MEILQKKQDQRGEKIDFQSLGAPGDARIRCRVRPDGRIARCNWTGAVLAPLTFDGG
jgi:hypothetical protein